MKRYYFLKAVLLVFFFSCDDEPEVKSKSIPIYIINQTHRPTYLPKLLTPVNEECSIDTINDQSPKGYIVKDIHKLKVSGWAGDIHNGILLKDVTLKFTGPNIIYAKTFEVVKRDDVMKMFNQPDILDSGWTFYIDLADAKPGEYRIEVIRSEGEKATICDPKTTIIIKL